jgi:hypothetical protein
LPRLKFSASRLSAISARVENRVRSAGAWVLMVLEFHERMIAVVDSGN